MAIVVFDIPSFRLKYPQFTSISDTQLQFSFDTACLYLNNTDSSPITDIAVRAQLLDLLTAHITQLNINATAGNGVVGRLSSASEGGVSSSFEYAPATQSNAWYNQTPYGAQYWTATSRYRRFSWVKPSLIPAGARRGV